MQTVQLERLIVIECYKCKRFSVRGIQLPKGTEYDDIKEYFVSYDLDFEEEECGNCRKIQAIKLKQIKNWLKEAEDEFLLELWQKYLKPKNVNHEKLIPRESFSNLEEYLMCPCDDPLISIGYDNDISGYRCMGCGTESWIP